MTLAPTTNRALHSHNAVTAARERKLVPSSARIATEPGAGPDTVHFVFPGTLS